MASWYISGLRVVYTDKDIPPSDSIPEINMGPADINYEFGGKFVWLIPEWTKSPNDACTWLGLEVVDNGRPAAADLAKGAGGKYRYIAFRKDQHLQAKIKEVALWRKAGEHGAMNLGDVELLQARGYNDYSTDINFGRGKSYLYLVWKRG